MLFIKVLNCWFNFCWNYTVFNMLKLNRLLKFSNEWANFQHLKNYPISFWAKKEFFYYMLNLLKVQLMYKNSTIYIHHEYWISSKYKIGNWINSIIIRDTCLCINFIFIYCLLYLHNWNSLCLTWILRI